MNEEEKKLTEKAQKTMSEFTQMAELERNAIFMEHLKSKHPNLDVNLAVEIFNEEIAAAKTGAPPGADNKDLRLPLGCDLNKNILICIIDKYITRKENQLPNGK